MKIRITRGAYGFNDGSSVEIKTASSGYFTVSDSEGRRLVALGVAEMQKETVATADKRVSEVKETSDKVKAKPSKNGKSAKNRSTRTKEDSVVASLTAEMPE